MTKVYLDMDGVLVDFNKGLEVFNIQNDTTFIHRPREEWTPVQIKLDREVVDCMNTDGFFRDLPMMPGALELWKVQEPYVLTAWPTTTNDRLRCAREKKEWIEDTFGVIPDDRFICCARADKAKYATSFSAIYGSTGDPNVLIDDMENNCLEWERAGGVAVHFQSMNQAIEDLRKVLDRLG